LHVAHTVTRLIYDVFYYCLVAFSALTLLAGRASGL